MKHQNLYENTTSVDEPLEYAIVIATRNRADALAISLPSMLNQTRLPKSIVIVDSSDDKSCIERRISDVGKNYRTDQTGLLGAGHLPSAKCRSRANK
jgi:hypothetical protein